jgi:SAM-dependent methyltransferase
MLNSSFGRAGYYGIESPFIPSVQAFLAIVMLEAGYNQVNDTENPERGGLWLMVFGGLLLAIALAYLQATRRGRFRAWSRELGALDLRGDETILDVGCGRGAVTTLAAARVPDGRVVGVDLWVRSRWSGSGRRGPDDQIAKNNAVAEGVGDRVSFIPGDIDDLASEGNYFDVVVSGGGIGRLGSNEARMTALDEAVRVLKPGGQLLVADVRNSKRYVERLTELGCEDVRSHSAGPECWYGGPWLPLVFVTARKPAG